MTNDILEHLNDVLVELKRLSSELDESMNDTGLVDSIASELEDNVVEPLLNVIDNLDHSPITVGVMIIIYIV